MGQDLFTLFALLGILTGLTFFYGAPLRIIPTSPVLAIILLIGNVGGIFLFRRVCLRQITPVLPEVVAIGRDWFSFLVILLIYENLLLYTGFIQPDVMDPILAEMEILIWSVQPTVWIEQYIHPLAVDLMSIAYAFHFPLTFGLAYGLYLFNKRAYYREFVTALIFCNVAGFILYLIFPTGPPRFFLESTYHIMPLPSFSGLYTWTDAFWDGNNPVPVHSSFPSLHVAFSTITLIYAFRKAHWPDSRRWLGPVVTVMAISLWASTIYLRHHWSLDIIFGWILGLMSVLVARYLTTLVAPEPDFSGTKRNRTT